MHATTYLTATGIELPRLGLGTWQMGVSAAARRDEVRALDLGLELGMTLVDTAEMYAEGGAEHVVGEMLRAGNGRRERAFIVSKVLPENASRRGTIEACERSLARLGIDRLDLYLLHWEGSHPLEDTLAAFEELRTAGKIRSYGLSNFDHDQVNRTAMHHPGLTANQVLYNLGRRGVERRLLAECARRRIALMAYSPFEQARLRWAALAQLATRLECTPAQIALAFLLRHPHVVVIPKASSLAHVRENARAWEVLARLGPAELAEIDAAFPAPARDMPLEML